MPRKIKDRSFLFQYIPKNAIIAEIGVATGVFSEQLLTTNPKELHLIDPWVLYDDPEHAKAGYGTNKATQEKINGWLETVQVKFHKEIINNQVRIHRNYSYDLLPTFPDNYFDFIYIDGDHTYNGVKKDLNLAYNKIKIGGHIACDDYESIGWWKNGVTHAVNEFVKNKNIKIIKVSQNQAVLNKG